MIRKRRTKPRPGRLDADGMAKLRSQVFERDGYRCQHQTPGLLGWIFCRRLVTWDSGHLAHIKSRGAGGNDTLENVYTCCADCHTTFHRCGPTMQKPVPAKEKP